MWGSTDNIDVNYTFFIILVEVFEVKVKYVYRRDPSS